MAARRFRHGSHTEYIISLDADNLSVGCNAYLGKLRSVSFLKCFVLFHLHHLPSVIVVMKF